MGAWGTALFSDNTATDVRDDYRDLVGDGLSGPAATDRLLSEWQSTLSDPDEGPVFWLALAATQWRCGRLEPRVLDKALEVIATGAGLSRWRENPPLLKKRQAVLAKLEAELRSPPPAEKRIPKRFRDHCDWAIGEVIAYRLRSGKWTLFRTIRLDSDKGGSYPICELLDWIGDEIPPRDELATLPSKAGRWTWFIIGRTSERELPQDRVQRPGIILELRQQKPPGGVPVYLWRSLDESLEKDFGVA